MSIHFSPCTRCLKYSWGREILLYSMDVNRSKTVAVAYNIKLYNNLLRKFFFKTREDMGFIFTLLIWQMRLPSFSFFTKCVLSFRVGGWMLCFWTWGNLKPGCVGVMYQPACPRRRTQGKKAAEQKVKDEFGWYRFCFEG